MEVPLLAPVASTSSGLVVRGRTEPRLWTPPLRDLSDPASSYGYDLIDFAADIGWPLDPWEQWAAIHMGELLPDGRPRFRFVLILVARQNGKTTLCRVLTLYWMFIECHELILGTSTSRDTAKVSWRKTIEMAEASELCAEELDPLHTRETIGEETFFNMKGSNYRFAAPNRRAGRSFTINRLLLDELREHKDHDTYDAAFNAMNAVWDAQAVAITNQGDVNSVVLDELRESALEYIETGVGDSRLFLAEWSAPNGADPTDPEALAQANPNLGIRIELDSLMGQAMRAKRAGGEQLARFRTEVMCQRVTNLDAAIDEDAWRLCGTDEPIDMADHRDRTALCLDVALDGSHATLVAAATLDGITHVEVVKAWNGYGCTKAVRAELPDLVQRIRPRTFGWFPGGPAAAITPTLKSKRGDRRWWPSGTDVVELVGEQAGACMGLAEQVLSVDVRHPRDEALNAHVSQAQKLKRGDTWLFTRRGDRPIDGTYALAGAVHLARTLKPRVPLHVA